MHSCIVCHGATELHPHLTLLYKNTGGRQNSSYKRHLKKLCLLNGSPLTSCEQEIYNLGPENNKDYYYDCGFQEESINNMSNYLTTANVSTTYQTINNMIYYLTTLNASLLYQTISGMYLYQTVSNANANNNIFYNAINIINNEIISLSSSIFNLNSANINNFITTVNNFNSYIYNYALSLSGSIYI